MSGLCGDKQQQQKNAKKWVGQAHRVEKVGGPLAHTVSAASGQRPLILHPGIVFLLRIAAINIKFCRTTAQ